MRCDKCQFYRNTGQCRVHDEFVERHFKSILRSLLILFLALIISASGVAILTGVIADQAAAERATIIFAVVLIAVVLFVSVRLILALQRYARGPTCDENP